MNRQLAEQDDLEEQQLQDTPQVVTASATSMRLSPPSNSKLAKRRQRSSLLKGAPVSASELRQLLAPLVIVGDCAWSVELGSLWTIFQIQMNKYLLPFVQIPLRFFYPLECDPVLSYTMVQFVPVANPVCFFKHWRKSSYSTLISSRQHENYLESSRQMN